MSGTAPGPNAAHPAADGAAAPTAAVGNAAEAGAAPAAASGPRAAEGHADPQPARQPRGRRHLGTVDVAVGPGSGASHATMHEAAAELQPGNAAAELQPGKAHPARSGGGRSLSGSGRRQRCPGPSQDGGSPGSDGSGGGRQGLPTASDGHPPARSPSANGVQVSWSGSGTCDAPSACSDTGHQRIPEAISGSGVLQSAGTRMLV